MTILSDSKRSLAHTKDPKPLSILHVIPNFYPATKWGGPVFSTKAICDSLANVPGVKLRVLTTDAAGPNQNDALPLAARTVQMPAGYEVTYFKRIFAHSISPQLIRVLPKAIAMTDIVHVTSAYSFPVLPTLALAKTLGRPVVWSPRGAIQAADEWADAPRKSAKRAFETVARLIAPSSSVLHVTAESEAIATNRRMPGFRTSIIPNGVELPPIADTVEREWRPNGRLRLVFLSRLHEKKGLEVLFESLVQLPSEVELHVYGSGSNDYLYRLMSKVQKLGLDKRVSFHGHVDGADKSSAFRTADLFVLPSYSENFGIVVAEALAFGVPVLTTDSTPWERLTEKGCGECIPLSVEALTKAIVELSKRDLPMMGVQGRIWMEEQFSKERTGAAMLELYREMVAAKLYRRSDNTA